MDVTSVAAQDFVTEVKRFDKEVSALLTTDNEKASFVLFPSDPNNLQFSLILLCDPLGCLEDFDGVLRNDGDGCGGSLDLRYCAFLHHASVRLPFVIVLIRPLLSFHEWIILLSLLVPVLGEKVATDLMGAGAHPELANPNEIGGYDILVLLSVLRKGDSWWVRIDCLPSRPFDRADSICVAAQQDRRFCRGHLQWYVSRFNGLSLNSMIILLAS